MTIKPDEIKKVNKLAVDFLVKQVNPFYLDAYNTLATLEYPIDDYESLRKQLITDENNGSEKLIRLVLESTDMPLSSPQSGMEKFHARLLALLDYGRGYEGPREIPGIPLPDIPEGSSPVFQYHHIVAACKIRAEAAADRCCTRGTIEWLIRYLEFLWRCIESGGFPRLSIPTRPEDFMSRG